MWSPRLKSSQKSVTMVLSIPSLPSHKTISNVDYATEDHHHISKKKRRLQTIPHQQTGSQEITAWPLVSYYSMLKLFRTVPFFSLWVMAIAPSLYSNGDCRYFYGHIEKWCWFIDYLYRIALTIWTMVLIRFLNLNVTIQHTIWRSLLSNFHPFRSVDGSI